jgi:hypothetical protein
LAGGEICVELLQLRMRNVMRISKAGDNQNRHDNQNPFAGIGLLFQMYVFAFIGHTSSSSGSNEVDCGKS